MTLKPDDNPVNILEQIRKLSREFGKQITQGNSPRIQSFLTKVTEEAREDLFRDLLAMEINLRRSKGESPSSDEYIKRFPQFKKQVRRAFFEPTLGSVDSSVHGDGDDHTASLQSPGPESAALDPTFELPDANRLGDYELVRKLGQGGMGIVYEAQHTKTNNRVALKTLPTGGDGQQVNADKLYRFRKEFRRLSEINHPNLVGMQSLEVDGERWFFTMDLIDGEDFLSHVRPDDQLDEDRLRSCLKQLATGVLELHRRGIIHRDLKPSNVLVSSDGHVTILDFGLAAQLQRAGEMTQTKSGMFAGTPPYAAPEQMFGERTEASDWYAFGTMLFEALAGERPFKDPDPMQLLRVKQEQDPPQLADRDGVPSDLSALADGLLRREPNLRLASDAIGTTLGLEEETRTAGSTRGSQGSAGSADAEDAELEEFEEEEIVLIGREKQLIQLEAARDELIETGRPDVVFISGLSGEGKSSLAEKFLRPIRRGNEMLVLSGRCFDRESIPFKAIDCWMDSLVSFLRSRPEAYLREVLPGDIVGLAQIFPLLRRIPLVESMPSIENALMTPEILRHRSFGALRDLLVNISRTTPVILFLDDLQWGDADSASVFQRILKMPGAPALLMLGSYRRDERDGSAFLDGFEGLELAVSKRTVEVAPLSEQEAIELFARQFPESAQGHEEAVRVACHEAGGNPYFLQQLIDGFVVSKGEFHTQPLDEIIAERLSRLPDDATKLLEMLAVFGQPVATAEASQLAGLVGEQFAILTRMRNEKLVRLLGSGESQQIDTVHDKIRETVLARLGDSERRDWHNRIARSLEKLVGTVDLVCEQESTDDVVNSAKGEAIPRLFDLAYHFYKAGEPRALDYQLWAGEQSLRAYSNVEAIDYFQRARELAGDRAPMSIRFRILFGLGQSHLRCRQARDAVELLASAVDCASTQVQRVRVYATLATAHSNLGLTSHAVHYGDLALNELGRPRPASTIRQMLQSVYCILTLRPGGNSGSRGQDEQANKMAIQECEILSGMVYDLQEQSTIAAFDAAFRSCNAGYQSGDPVMSTISSSGAAQYYAALGWSKRASAFHHEFDLAKTAVFSPEMLAVSRFNEGMCHYFRAQFGTSEEALGHAVSHAEQCGNGRQVLYALHLNRHVQSWSDSTTNELEIAQRVLRTASELGDPKGICWGSYDGAGAYARAGQLTKAFSLINQARHQFGHEKWSLTQSIFGSVFGYVLMQSSSYPQAREVLEHAWDNVKRVRLYYEYTVHSLPLLLQSIVGPDWQEPLTKVDRKQAATLNRWTAVLYSRYPPLHPLMLCTQGRFAASRGKHRKAARRFERSAKVAQTYGMPYFRARALLDLAAVKDEGRNENRAEAIRLLKEMESVIPRAESWLLGNQYDESVVAPKFDLEAWEREHGPISWQFDVEV